MCKIERLRKTNEFVYITIDDEEKNYWGVKKMPLVVYEYVRQFKNPDILNSIGIQTDVEDEGAYVAEVFYDENFIAPPAKADFAA